MADSYKRVLLRGKCSCCNKLQVCTNKLTTCDRIGSVSWQPNTNFLLFNILSFKGAKTFFEAASVSARAYTYN
jgi:hypothetical protein